MTESVRIKTIRDGVAGIRDAYIEEAEATRSPTRTVLIRITALAAAIALLIAIPLLRSYLTPGQTAEPFFVITAKAESGETVTLSSPGDYTSAHLSAPEGSSTSIFGDHETFSFDVKVSSPAELGYDLTVSYNGNDVTVTSQDSHIFIGYMFPSAYNQYASSFRIGGWFDEPTEVELILKNDAGIIIQKTVILISYSDSYQIELLDIQSELN